MVEQRHARGVIMAPRGKVRHDRGLAVQHPVDLAHRDGGIGIYGIDEQIVINIQSEGVEERSELKSNGVRTKLRSVFMANLAIPKSCYNSIYIIFNVFKAH